MKECEILRTSPSHTNCTSMRCSRGEGGDGEEDAVESKKKEAGERQERQGGRGGLLSKGRQKVITGFHGRCLQPPFRIRQILQILW